MFRGKKVRRIDDEGAGTHSRNPLPTVNAEGCLCSCRKVIWNHCACCLKDIPETNVRNVVLWGLQSIVFYIDFVYKDAKPFVQQLHVRVKTQRNQTTKIRLADAIS
eukprot:1443-Heterococcus_DN1.PRE.4